jgi:hypothetical protein
MSPQLLLTFEFPSIYLETITDPVTGIPGGPASQRTITYTPIFQSLGMTEVPIEKMEMYINNIFVNPEIKSCVSVHAKTCASLRAQRRRCASSVGNTLKLREPLACAAC